MTKSISNTPLLLERKEHLETKIENTVYRGAGAKDRKGNIQGVH